MERSVSLNFELQRHYCCTFSSSYMLLADYAEYVKAQERVDQLYKVSFEKRLAMNFSSFPYRIQ